MSPTKKKLSLKDQLFNRTKVEFLAKQIQKAFPKFKTKDFSEKTLLLFPKLELKERIIHIRKTLKEFLPNDYSQALKILLNSLGPKLDPNLSDDDFGDFIYAPISDFVAAYGCTNDYVEISLNALREITMRFSAEDAIRYFINAFPKQTLAKINLWKKHSNYHVRRLCSEGLRPKLPWSQKINLDFSKAGYVLDTLCHDQTRYVTRSVANHLNDIAKFDATWVIGRLKKWQAQKKQPKDLDFIIRHSLRTLVKLGNPKALELLGFDPKAKVEVKNFQIKKTKINLGDFLEFSFLVQSPKEQKIIVDYRIYFLTKKSKPSPKVFKLKQLSLTKNKPQYISKKHPFLKKMTTRKIIPGMHQLVLQINGKDQGKQDFEVLASR